MAKKIEVLITDLVNHFGDGAIISRPQLLEFVNSKQNNDYPHHANITNDIRYRANIRGHYVVTDKFIKMKKPKKEKMSDKTLLKLLVEEHKRQRQEKSYVPFIEQDDYSGKYDSIEDIMRYEI